MIINKMEEIINQFNETHALDNYKAVLITRYKFTLVKKLADGSLRVVAKGRISRGRNLIFYASKMNMSLSIYSKFKQLVFHLSVVNNKSLIELYASRLAPLKENRKVDANA